MENLFLVLVPGKAPDNKFLVEADEVFSADGVLMLSLGDKIVVAFAPGHWHSVKRAKRTGEPKPSGQAEGA